MAPVAGFIGTGNMGAAIIRGLAPLGSVEIVGCDLNAGKLAELAADTGMAVAQSPAEVAGRADYVVLCVKPQHLREVLASLRPSLTGDKCLVSIAAGITMEKLADWSGDACPVVRIMPNTPALVGPVPTPCAWTIRDFPRRKKNWCSTSFPPSGRPSPCPKRTSTPSPPCPEAARPT